MEGVVFGVVVAVVVVNGVEVCTCSNSCSSNGSNSC